MYGLIKSIQGEETVNSVNLCNKSDKFKLEGVSPSLLDQWTSPSFTQQLDVTADIQHNNLAEDKTEMRSRRQTIHANVSFQPAHWMTPPLGTNPTDSAPDNTSR